MNSAEQRRLQYRRLAFFAPHRRAFTLIFPSAAAGHKTRLARPIQEAQAKKDLFNAIYIYI
jgi:hypothetical protein